MKNFVNTGIMPDSDGYFGKFGGKFLPSNLDDEFRKIFENFLKLKDTDEFKSELHRLLRDYVGRPNPIYHAKNLSKKYGAQIYLKREDLNHTGAHKINNAVGMALLAKRIGKTKLIAETGAGQHGVAVATAAALLQLKCDVYMGEVDIKKQKTNVEKIKILGANIISVKDGTGTLKEAVDAALLAYSKELEHSLFALGSVVGPHPFPMIVEYFQSVIGTEARAQFLENTGKLPDHVVACIGGGSNAIGMFDGFINDESVKLYGVEALGRGTKLGDNAASITYGKYGILHGFKCLFLQDKEGNTADAYSIASGLDYPGVGPKHCFLHETGRVKYDTIDDKEAISAFYELSRTEGIIPALESAHAIAYAKKLAINKPDETILVNLSGRGDKDVEFVQSIAKCSKT